MYADKKWEKLTPSTKNLAPITLAPSRQRLGEILMSLCCKSQVLGRESETILHQQGRFSLFTEEFLDFRSSPSVAFLLGVERMEKGTCWEPKRCDWPLAENRNSFADSPQFRLRSSHLFYVTGDWSRKYLAGYLWEERKLGDDKSGKSF